MRIIRSKFPQKTRDKVGEMRQRNNNWAVEELIHAFDEVIDRLEIMEDTDPIPFSSSQSTTINNVWEDPQSPRNPRVERYSKGRETSPYTGSRSGSRRSEMSYPRASKPRELLRCSFCVRTGHNAYECNEVTSPYARRKMAAELHLCWKCLKTGQRSSQCNAQPCHKCGKAHNSALCYIRSRSRSTSRSISPRQRYPSRSSTDSNCSNLNLKRKAGSTSRSPSPIHTARSTRRNNKQSRRRSPHSRVGFKNPPTSRTYSTPSHGTEHVTAYELTREVEYVENGLEAQQDDLDSDSDLFLVNTVQTIKTPSTLNYTPQASTCKVTSLRNPPRLMIIKAQTYNFNSKSNQLLTVLLDNGSQHSYLKRDTATVLGLQLQYPQEITTVSFGGHSQTETSHRVKIVLQNAFIGNPTTLYL
uniref:DUF1758 domain-containing protein n=1 Tax=Haemonchus contortus TaxID=6289 RepID=A0A7I4Y5J1_HAECO